MAGADDADDGAARGAVSRLPQAPRHDLLPLLEHHLRRKVARTDSCFDLRRAGRCAARAERTTTAPLLQCGHMADLHAFGRSCSAGFDQQSGDRTTRDRGHSREMEMTDRFR